MQVVKVGVCVNGRGGSTGMHRRHQLSVGGAGGNTHHKARHYGSTPQNNSDEQVDLLLLNLPAIRSRRQIQDLIIATQPRTL